MSVNKDGEKFTAKISISDDYKDFIIKEVSGTIESLSYDEQKEKIKFFLQKVVNNENEIEDKKEKWENVSKKISESVETKETDEKNIKEKWQKLRQEISQYVDEQNENKDSKDKTYIKK